MTPDRLAALRDIHLPPAPPLWPPAPGWWALGVLALLSVAAIIWVLRRRAQRARRVAAIEALLADAVRESGEDQARLLAALSAILRRVALGRYPRAEVAHLTGAEWLGFLDRSGGGGQFGAGPGAVLAYGPYQTATEYDRAALVRLARRWIRRNLV
ncbi:MAG: DUF4381 domain-containing protein [Thiotrichales bacterium]